MKYFAGLTSNQTRQTVAVANAEDQEVLHTVQLACSKKLCRFHLFGEVEKIKAIAAQLNFSLETAEIILEEAKGDQESADKAVLAVQAGHAQVLMKGKVPTRVVMEAVLNKNFGLRTGKLLSHIALFEIPGWPKPLFLTDAAINIAPVLEEKVQMITNAVEVANRMGITVPKVAALAAIETVHPDMQATMDGAILAQMQKQGQIGKCLVEGPLSFDTAVSMQAAKQKGIESEVAGQADILLVPHLDVGNVLYKSFVHAAKAQVAGVVAGAAAPIVLPSRADTAANKLNSLIMALLSVDEEE